MTSSRLPGKVLMPLSGKPMLMQQVARVTISKKIDKLVVATSTDKSDDEIEKLCKQHGIEYFRGDLEDVLKRYYRAARKFNATDIVRLTGDCPLIDPEVIDEIISFYQKKKFDYASNTINPTYPDGLDVEIFSFRALEEAFNEAKLPSEREHVTPFILKQPNRFSLGNYKNSTDLSDLRWTVDESRDFELVKNIYEALYPVNKNFTTSDVLDYLSVHPEVSRLNNSIERNNGMKKSIKKDTDFISNEKRE